MCVVDGMCEVKCLVGINIGEFVKSIRNREMEIARSVKFMVGMVVCNFGVVMFVVLLFLNMVFMVYGIFGEGVLKGVLKMLNKVSGVMISVWNSYMFIGVFKFLVLFLVCVDVVLFKGIFCKVVYLLLCVICMMGLVKGEEVNGGVVDAMMSILDKVKYEVVYFEGFNF